MYIKDGRLHYNYNFLDGEHHHLVSKPLPKGKTDLMSITRASQIDFTDKPDPSLDLVTLSNQIIIGIDH